MATKSNSATSDRFVSDIIDCVSALKELFHEESTPVTDDSIPLQKLCSKLEFILQNGLKERTSILGHKKDYWDYICQCLASRKYVHDGIRYVKLNSDVKTSKGKGRAFLRFCLVHGCLADSLQQCFMHEATKDWYHDWALPLQREKWSSFVSKMYDLSEVTFNLSSDCFDLDVTWPTFSRSQEPRFSWRPPSRSISISSLNSQVQMEHPLGLASGSDFPDFQEEVFSEDLVGKLKLELDQSEMTRTRLQQRVEEMEANEAKLKKQLLELQATNESITSAQAASANAAIELELARLRILDLEKQNLSLQKSLSDSEQQLQGLRCEKEEMSSVINESNVLINELQKSNASSNSELSVLQANFEVQRTELSDVSQAASQLEEQLFKAEQQLKEADKEKTDFLSWIAQLQSDNDNMKEATTVLTAKNELLNCEISDLKTELNNTCDKLSKIKTERNNLKKEVKSVSALQKKVESSKATERNLEDAEHTIKILESKIVELNNNIPDVALASKITDLEMKNISLSQELQSTTNRFQCQISSLCSERDDLTQAVQKLEEKNHYFITQVQEKNEAISNANMKVTQFEQMRNSLLPLYNQQDKLVISSEKLNSDIKTLASVLFCIANGNYMTWEPKEVNESTPENTNSSSEVGAFEPKTISRLKDLLEKSERVEMILQTCALQCRDLIGLSREHQKKLALQHFDLQGTKRVVDTLTKEHKKLQTAEAILKHELGEKKKLLASLRRQVESTREEWNRNRIKTAQSEIEWQNLREEFAARHKQSSEESGFVDDRHSESATSEGTTDEQNTDENLSDPPSDEVAAVDSLRAAGPAHLSPSPSGSGLCAESVDTNTQPRSRLDILEEQYQLLYSSLLRSSKRSEALEQRIESLLSNTEAYCSRGSSRSTPSQEIPGESSSEIADHLEVSEQDITPPNEDYSQSSISLENGPDSDNAILDVSVESLDSDSSNLVSNGDGLHSFDVQGSVDEDNERRVTETSSREPLSVIRKRTLENFVSQLKEEKMARKAKEADLIAQIQTLLTEKLNLESKFLNLQQEKQLIWSKESEFRKRAEFIFRQERDSFETKLSSLSQERLQLLKEVEELKANLMQTEEKQNNTESTLKEYQEEMEEKESSLKHQIEALKFQMSTEAIKYERALKHYNEQESGIRDMKEKMNSQEVIIESLEESLKEIKEERMIERDKQWHELEDLQVSLSTRDEECSAMNEELRKTMRELDETRNQVSNLQTASNQAEKDYRTTVSSLENMLVQIKSDNESLKKQIIKLTKDKDVLWKKAETLSQLQFSPTRDRWMSDSEVTECLGCKSTFSFTLRKHHCRLCGRIFCHNCANHWVMMASSSRRARICTECNAEHIDKTGKQPTTPVDQEGSEEDQVDSAAQLVPIQAPANSSFDTASVDSLPISGRQDSSPSVMEALAEVDSNNSEENPNLDQTFLSDNLKMDFDVISDEEIARSLSACSPYSPAPSPISGSDPEVQTTATRSIKDIVSNGSDGVSGEIWVNAGTSYSVPVLLDQEEVILSWEFTSEPKSVAFSVTYREESSDAGSQEVLLQTTRVQSHLQPVQGHLIAKHPGLYTLVFSNQFSRYMAKKVSYTLKILNYDAENNTEENVS